VIQLSINPDIDEDSEIGVNGNKNCQIDTDGDAEYRNIPNTNKILLCSSNEAVSKRWHGALSAVGELSVVSSLENLFSHLRSYPTEVVLVDLELFEKGYREIPETLCQSFPHVSFIALSPLPNDGEGLYLISHGVKGYCNRYISQALLIKAVELVHMGEIWVGRSLLFKLMNRLGSVSEPKGERQGMKADADVKLAKLTGRESEIAQLVGVGDSNKVIAKKLDITERTVKAHLSAIFRKTATKDRLQLGLLINA
jgi:DNA-binding NarL/FixJ family response regulator